MSRVMQERRTAFVLSLSVLAVLLVVYTAPLLADSHNKGEAPRRAQPAQFNDAGELIRPEGWREWIFVGTPVTPHDMNKDKAAFPEFHNVYVDPESYYHWQKTGEWREGMMMAKELTLVGAKKASSGKGYFQGEFSGFEIALKSKARYPDEPGNWAYFTFGHKPEPYDKTAKAQPTEACAACHEALADDDMVFTQYYPVLRAAKPN